MTACPRLNSWIAEGAMDHNCILHRLDERMTDFGNATDEQIAQLNQNFQLFGTIDNGTPRLDQTAFLAFLHSHGALPSSLTEAGSVLYSILQYLSQAPFSHRQPLPQALTAEEFLRALTWTHYEKACCVNCEGNRCRGRTPADHRRLLFQSLATYREDRDFPLDVKEWRRQAERRAFELPEFRDAGINCDEDGDEMYHDVLDVVFSTQPVVDEALALVERDEFRSIAKELHGNDVRLHELVIPPGRLHALVKLLLVARFGHCGMLPDEQLPELDCVAGSIVKSFHRIPDSGITWPVFDEAARTVPLLFDTVYTISSNLLGQPETLADLEQVIPEPGKILTCPKLVELASVLDCNFAWDDLRLFCQYDPANHTNTASSLAAVIGTLEGPILLLVSGKVLHESVTQNAVFGTLIANTTYDDTEIQPKPQVDQDSTLLFQLSPVHDIFRGNVGRAGWSVVREELCFGERDGGVALVFAKDLKGATVTHRLDGEDKAVYTPSKWRGTWSTQLKVEAIEIWNHPY